MRTIEREARPATPDEQLVLARWSGWGAVPEVFDARRPEYAWAREQLAALLSPQEMAAAARNTLNAHYTDAGIVQAVWSAVQSLGFTGGRVLEPGCGSGNFIGFAPAAAQMTGVELDPVTAAIAAALHPRAQILAESFADTRDPDGSYDLAIGNVPFARAALHDRRHNPGGHSIHNHFIIKALRLVRPGGLVAVLTSRYTMDARNPAARREMASLGRSGGGGPAAERGPPEDRRHRRGDRPADPAAPRARAAARTRARGSRPARSCWTGIRSPSMSIFSPARVRCSASPARRAARTTPGTWLSRPRLASPSMRP